MYVQKALTDTCRGLSYLLLKMKKVKEKLIIQQVVLFKRDIIEYTSVLLISYMKVLYESGMSICKGEVFRVVQFHVE